MKFKIVETLDLFEMANARRKKITVANLDFSFYFGTKASVNNQHGIRAKLCWNREKVGSDLLDGVLELHGDYHYQQTAHPNHNPNQAELDTARQFFKSHKVLFAAVWEGVLDEHSMVSYLYGEISLNELLAFFELPNEQKQLVTEAADNQDLERIVRAHHIYNLND